MGRQFPLLLRSNFRYGRMPQIQAARCSRGRCCAREPVFTGVERGRFSRQLEDIRRTYIKKRDCIYESI